MYKRKEVIEEEHLDWEKKPKDTVQQKDFKGTLESEAKHKKLLLNKESGFKNKSDIEHNVMTYFNGNEYLWLGLIVLIVPYLVGLLFNTLLFYIYSGITFDKVFSIEKESKIFELWTIGAYTFVTIWILWVLLKMFKEGR